MGFDEHSEGDQGQALERLPPSLQIERTSVDRSTIIDIDHARPNNTPGDSEAGLPVSPETVDRLHLQSVTQFSALRTPCFDIYRKYPVY